MTNGTHSMAATFYAGGIDEVRTLLQRAIVCGRAQKGFTNDELDAICMFEHDSLPKSKNFEADSSLINQQVFCRASYPLGLAADVALEAETHVTAKHVPGIIEQMKRTGEGAVFACGGDGKPIPLEDQAKVYVVLKILQELG